MQFKGHINRGCGVEKLAMWKVGKYQPRKEKRDIKIYMQSLKSHVHQCDLKGIFNIFNFK